MEENFIHSPSSQIQVIDLPAAGDSTSEEENPRNTPLITRHGRPRLYRQGARPREYVQETWPFSCQIISLSLPRMSVSIHVCLVNSCLKGILYLFLPHTASRRLRRLRRRLRRRLPPSSTHHHPHSTINKTSSTHHHQHNPINNITINNRPSTQHHQHITINTTSSTHQYQHITINTTPSTNHHQHLLLRFTWQAQHLEHLHRGRQSGNE